MDPGPANHIVYRFGMFEANPQTAEFLRKGVRVKLQGKPVQNAHVESFHGKLRDECLNASWNSGELGELGGTRGQTERFLLLETL